MVYWYFSRLSWLSNCMHVTWFTGLGTLGLYCYDWGGGRLWCCAYVYETSTCCSQEWSPITSSPIFTGLARLLDYISQVRFCTQVQQLSTGTTPVWAQHQTLPPPPLWSGWPTRHCQTMICYEWNWSFPEVPDYIVSYPHVDRKESVVKCSFNFGSRRTRHIMTRKQ